MGIQIDKIPNRHLEPTYLLRRSYRDGKKVCKETLANLTSLSIDQIEAMRMILKGQKLVPVEEAFDVIKSRQHGTVQAVLKTMERLGFKNLIASKSSKERDLVVAMVAARIIDPDTKLATTRWWHNTTLPTELNVADATENDLYKAMDWLLDHKKYIEPKLARRHLGDGSNLLYDLSSSYFEGDKCPLAKRGYNRDRKKGKLQVNYGLLTDERGCPITVRVVDGNVSDTKTFMPQIDQIRDEFGIKKMVIIGDRGMVSQKQIDQIHNHGGIDWITALRSGSIRKLIDDKSIQPELFDERNLFEIEHPDYPGERLIACRNPYLAKHRAKTRQSLLEKTIERLEKVQKSVQNGRIKGADKIGIKVGKIIDKYKVAKHFDIAIGEDSFDFSINQERVAKESALDGVYVIRTSVSKDSMDAETAVRNYKNLSQVERAFRSMKSIDLMVRPIHHRLGNRVRAHIFLCMLAYYVQWHMRRAWSSLLFTDEDEKWRKMRDPVATAQPSKSAKAKKSSGTKHSDEDKRSFHSFRTLLSSLSTIVQNTCKVIHEKSKNLTFETVTKPDKTQHKALELIEKIEM